MAIFHRGHALDLEIYIQTLNLHVKLLVSQAADRMLLVTNQPDGGPSGSTIHMNILIYLYCRRLTGCCW